MIVDRLNPIRASVRTRSTVAAAVVMTGCLVIAGGVLLLVLYASLERTAQTAAAARAEQVSQQLQTDSPGDLDPSLLVTDSQVGAVQIVDDNGAVLAASNGAPHAPLATTALSNGQTRRVGRIEDAASGFDYRVTARADRHRGGTVTILVGADREPVESVVTRVGSPAGVRLPDNHCVDSSGYLSAGRGGVTAGRKIRARVASISSTDLAERVPVPGARDEIAQLATTMNAMLGRSWKTGGPPSIDWSVTPPTNYAAP